MYVTLAVYFQLCLYSFPFLSIKIKLEAINRKAIISQVYQILELTLQTVYVFIRVNDLDLKMSCSLMKSIGCTKDMHFCKLSI